MACEGPFSRIDCSSLLVLHFCASVTGASRMRECGRSGCICCTGRCCVVGPTTPASVAQSVGVLLMRPGWLSRISQLATTPAWRTLQRQVFESCGIAFSILMLSREQLAMVPSSRSRAPQRAMVPSVGDAGHRRTMASSVRVCGPSLRSYPHSSVVVSS